MEQDEFFDIEPYEFQDAKRHARYFGWGVALAAFGWSLYEEVTLRSMGGTAVLLACVNFIFFYGATFATVYAIYFLLPMFLPQKPNDPPPAQKGTGKTDKPSLPLQQPPRQEFAANPLRAQLVNRIVDADSILITHQQEIQQARNKGGMERVSQNEITRYTSAKKWGEGNPAKHLYDALVEACFIDDSGNWTETGVAYSFPRPITTAPTGGIPTGGNRWEPENNRWQPVGEG